MHGLGFETNTPSISNKPEARKDALPVVLTIGHSMRTLEDFVALLEACLWDS
jgi:hypothetical protein